MSKKQLLTALIVTIVSARSAALAGSGFLGVQLAEEIPEAVLSHLELEGGAMVLDVVADSPAEKAGLARHDVVIAVGEKAVTSADALRDIISKQDAGSEISLQVRRGARTLALAATLGARDDGALTRKEKENAKKPGFLGVRFESMTELLATHLGIEKDTGVVVGEALNDSPAAKAGLRRFDVVLKIAGGTVKSWRQPPDGDAGARQEDAFVPRSNLPELIREHFAGDEIELEIISQGRRKKVRVTLGEAPANTVPPYPLPVSPEEGFPRFFDGRRSPDSFLFGVPRTTTRGKILWYDENGKKHEIELPGMDHDAAKTLENLRLHLESLDSEKVPEALMQELHKAYEQLRRIGGRLPDLRQGGKGPHEPRPWPGKKSTSSSRSSTYHSVTPDGDVKIEIHEKNGERRVSVKRNGKQLAKDLPWEKIETLPKEIQELLKKNAGKGSIDLRTPNNSLRLELHKNLRVPGEKRGRAGRKRLDERKPDEKKKLDPKEKKRQIKV